MTRVDIWANDEVLTTLLRYLRNTDQQHWFTACQPGPGGKPLYGIMLDNQDLGRRAAFLSLKFTGVALDKRLERV